MGHEHAAWRRVLVFLCAFAVVAAGLAGEAAAAAPRAVFALQALNPGGRAGYFIVDARPGATVRLAVRVVNTGNAAGTVRLDVVDGTTGQTTGAVFHDRRDPRTDVGAWVTPELGRVRLVPRQSQTVALTLRIPRGASDGQHLGGVVAENAVPTRGPTRARGGSSFRIDVRTLTIIAIQVNLPGRRNESMVVTGVQAGGSGGQQALLVGLHSKGNTLVKGSGELIVKDTRGRQRISTHFPIDTFVPHTQIADPIAVPGRALPAGGYNATVTLTYGSGHVASLTAPFTISRQQIAQVFGSRASQAPPPGEASASNAGGPPLLAFAIGGVLLLALGFLGAILVLRRRGPGRSAAPTSDQAPRP